MKRTRVCYLLTGVSQHMCLVVKTLTNDPIGCSNELICISQYKALLHIIISGLTKWWPEEVLDLGRACSVLLIVSYLKFQSSVLYILRKHKRLKSVMLHLLARFESVFWICEYGKLPFKFLCFGMLRVISLV